MKTENHVSYEQAVKLKELGFSEPCRAFYWTADGQFKETDQKVHANNPNCTTMVAAPHVWDVMRWLREVHDIHIEPDFVYKGNYDTYVKSGKRNIYRPIPARFKSYDDAVSAGLDAALGMLTKEKGNETE